MNGTIVDTLITLPRRQQARKRGASESGIDYIQTNAGSCDLWIVAGTNR